MLIALVVILLLLALWFFWQSGKRQKEAGLPLGRVVYDDSGAGLRVEQPLYDPVLRLTGKPDYILQEDGIELPVEVKSTKAPVQPYDGHLFQLMAYCLLLEKNTGLRPPHGILRYQGRTFVIDYTPELEKQLLEILEDLRYHLDKNQKEWAAGLLRSHQTTARCARCGYRQLCDQSL